MQHPFVAQISDQSEVQLYPHILRESQVWGEMEQIRGIWGIFICKAFFPMEHISVWPMRVVRSASKLPLAAQPQSTRVSKRAV